MPEADFEPSPFSWMWTQQRRRLLAIATNFFDELRETLILKEAEVAIPVWGGLRERRVNFLDYKALVLPPFDSGL